MDKTIQEPLPTETSATLRRSPYPQISPTPPLSSLRDDPDLVDGKPSKLYGECLWFNGPGYEKLYKEIEHQAFDGYTCIEKDLVQPDCRLPDRSIKFAVQYLETTYNGATRLSGQHIDLESHLGFNKSEFLVALQTHRGLTLGEAIQKLYMARLRESNKHLPITKVYEGGWTLEMPGEQQPKQAGTIWLGDVVDSVNLELLKQQNITAMVSVHPRDFRSKGQEKHGSNGEVKSDSPIRWRLHLQLADSKEADLESEFAMVFEFIQFHAANGRNVLVHCIAGLSRSVAVVRDFIQRIEVRLGSIDMTGTALEKFARMQRSRDATFQKLRRIRPGITEDNFRDQLDNSTMKLCGLVPKPRPAPGSHQQSKEHGGGGYIGDSVAMVFFFYRLRPTPRVIQLFEQRRIDHNRKEKELGQKRNGFSFPDPMVQWFEDCIHHRNVSLTP